MTQAIIYFYVLAKVDELPLIKKRTKARLY